MPNNYDAILKPLYPGDTVPDLSSTSRVFLTNVPKTDNFVGLGTLAIPIQVNNGGGTSLSSINVYLPGSPQVGVGTGASGNIYKTFQLVRAHGFGAATIENEVAAASKSDTGAFVDYMKREIDGNMDQLLNQVSFLCYSSSGGTELARRSGLSGEVVTVRSMSDVIRLRQGMTLVVGPNADGTGLRTITGGSGSDDGGPVGNAVTVAAVDEDAMTFTLTTGDAAAIGSFSANDYFFEAGSATSSFKGLDAWCPLATPSTSDSFLGVNRSTAPAKLAGHRIATSASLEVGVKKLATRIFSTASKAANIALCNPDDFDNLTTSLAGKGIYPSQGGDAKYSFRKVTIATSGGDVDVTPDPHCPAGRTWVTRYDVWKLHHLKGLPHFNVQGGGNRVIDSIDGTNTCTARLAWYGALACYNTGVMGTTSF